MEEVFVVLSIREIVPMILAKEGIPTEVAKIVATKEDTLVAI